MYFSSKNLEAVATFQMYSTSMNGSTGEDVQIYAAGFIFFPPSKKICYES